MQESVNKVKGLDSVYIAIKIKVPLVQPPNTGVSGVQWVGVIHGQQKVILTQSCKNLEMKLRLTIL